MKPYSAIWILAVVCIVGYFLLAPHSRPGHGPKFDRAVRFSKIGGAIERYSWDHADRLPAKLSDLVPGYFSTNELSVFYPAELKALGGTNLPLGWETKPELIDRYSDCVYLGSKGITHEVMAYERDGAWNRVPTTDLRIIYPGGGGTTFTKAHLDELLRSDSSALLERMRETRVMYYEGNLHASLNSYRLDFGSYPLGDNAKVTRILRGENPSKKHFHSTYEQEQNSRGEDLDPWGTPYFVESDGNRVRMKSAGRNRKFDQIGSSNYDDICFTVVGGSTIGSDAKF